jgi:DNA-binding MarR family transcriptional regulator/ribosomal protein S18 acetylase RimI-like enzyme
VNVLWASPDSCGEVGTNGADLRTLRERLALDSGYLTRMLRSLERQGLVLIQTQISDRRVRRACLTTTGLAEWAELERLADEAATRVLEPLSSEQRGKLVAAMSEVERLLQPSMVVFAIEDPISKDAKWCFEQYFAELDKRFESGFDPANSVSADAHELKVPKGALIMARLHGVPIGCIAIKLHKESSAELKRMWVSPSARGLGFGRRLLHEAEKHVLQGNGDVIRLETNKTLQEAITLYERSGYVEVQPFSAEPYAHHWFEKKLL